MICYRTMAAGYNAVWLVNRDPIYKPNEEEDFFEAIGFDKKAPQQHLFSVYDENNERHPKAQCRLDTFMAGALGQDRPTCWFNNMWKYGTYRFIQTLNGNTSRATETKENGCSAPQKK